MTPPNPTRPVSGWIRSTAGVLTLVCSLQGLVLLILRLAAVESVETDRVFA